MWLYLLVILLAVAAARKNSVIPSIDEKEWWGVGDQDNAVQDTTIRTFQMQWNEEMIEDLKYRLKNHRQFTLPLEGVAFQYGFNTEYLKVLLNYWVNEYNFTDRLASLNQYPQYKSKIQGLDLQFLWVKPMVSSSVQILPLLLLHGWPGSIKEFFKVIPLLTNQREGYDFVFEVIVPSIPGFGYSEGASRPGLGPVEIGVFMRNLMQRIGFSTFYVQGGDWGSIIGSAMATLFPEEILGYHTNFPFALNKDYYSKLALGEQTPGILEPSITAVVYPIAKWQAMYQLESGYLHLQSTKPDTIGVALSDSPVGLLAYILEKIGIWTNLSNKNLKDGGLSQYDKDDLLDNIMFYWAPNTITTSVRIYKEFASARTASYDVDSIPTSVPTWALHTAHEPFLNPANYMTTKFTRLIHVTVLNIGGHNPALEIPEEFADDVWKAHQGFLDFYANNLTYKAIDDFFGEVSSNPSQGNVYVMSMSIVFWLMGVVLILI